MSPFHIMKQKLSFKFLHFFLTNLQVLYIIIVYSIVCIDNKFLLHTVLEVQY